MYEERRDTFSVRDIILQILLIILFVLILVWLFPSKGYMKKLFGGSVKTEETTKIEASADDIDRLAALYNQIFANNIYAMKEAAIGYYTNERLPQTVGDVERMTLEEMYNKHLTLKLSDKDGNYCDATKSYVSITKYENEFQMKVNLSCGDEEDYIIVYLGCYDYCEANGVCEKEVPVKPGKNPISNPGTRPTSNPVSNPTSNSVSNPTSNPVSNPTSNPVSNPTSNPVSNPTSNPVSNPTSNPASNPTSNPVSNPTSNPASNPTSNPVSNPTSNPTECDYTTQENIELIFDTKGGSSISSIAFKKYGANEKIKIGTPVREGYKFLGWYADEAYTTEVNITSTKSEDLLKLEYVDIHDIIVDDENCVRRVTKTAFLYAKWEKEKNYICEYNKYTEGYWGPYGDWSEWSTTIAVNNESTEVQVEVRNEVTGYKTETVATGTKLETYVIGYEEKQVISGYNTEKYISGYKYDKYISGYTERKYISGYNEEKYISGYNTEKYVTGYKTEKYVSGQTTKKVKVGEQEETYLAGYNVEKYVTGYTTKKVKVGTEQKQTGTQTKTTVVKVPAGTAKIYVATDSGYVVPSNTSERVYEVIGTKMEQTCSGCVTKTIYTWKEYKLQTVYKSETKTETVPVYETVDVYEEKTVPVYGTKKVPVYETKKTPIYKTETIDVYSTRQVPVYGVKQVPVYSTKKTPIYTTETVPVYSIKQVPIYSIKKTPIYTTVKEEIYGTREVTIYEEVKVSIYSDVTYYRYRSREFFGGSVETRWSTCDPVDENLIKDGFKLTGNRKEA